MSVDKFGRRQAVVNVRRETKSTLSENIGIRLNDDGDLDVDNKRICNVGDPSSRGDAVPLKYVQDNCFITSEDSADFKGKRVINVNNPVELTDAVNKFYVDDRCLQYKDDDDDVIDARHHRITSVKNPQLEDDVASKRYVDTNRFIVEQQLMKNKLFASNELYNAVNSLQVYMKLFYAEVKKLHPELDVNYADRAHDFMVRRGDARTSEAEEELDWRTLRV